MRNSQIEVRPTAGTIGAEIHNVDVSRDLDDATIGDIRKALLDHCVIFFRNQKIDAEQHKAFTRRFGKIFIHPNYKGMQADPEVIQITREPGTHRTVVAPDGRFYADTWSNVETPPRLVVSSQDGTRRYVIDENAKPPILGFERGGFEWVEIAAADGTRLYGSLVKPPDFDPARRYPVIVSVYGGPHVQTVVNSWSHVSPRDSLLASRGFLVFKLDNRGSAARGTAFELPLHRLMGKVELEDQLAGVTYLKSLPYVDPARIGITGWSYGGYLTLYALTNAPDVFRSGVAGAPVTHWKHYDTIYTERYMGLPQDNPGGYEAASPLTKAGALEAELLLIHGMADDNVHVANTIAFVGALAKAGRPYQLRLHPGQLHGFRSKEDKIASDRALLAHFERTLEPGQ